MTVHFRKSINLDRSFWQVLIPGETPLGCTSKDETQHEYDSLHNQIGVRVVEFNAAEGWARDVTDEFAFPEEDDEPLDAFDIECSRADFIIKRNKEMAS